jgi:hypothetical protein
LETVVFIRNDLCRLRIITLIYLNVGEVADYDGRRRTALRWSVRAIRLPCYRARRAFW